MQDNELKNGQTVPPQDEAAQQAPADAPGLRFICRISEGPG